MRAVDLGLIVRDMVRAPERNSADATMIGVIVFGGKRGCPVLWGLLWRAGNG